MSLSRGAIYELGMSVFGSQGIAPCTDVDILKLEAGDCVSETDITEIFKIQTFQKLRKLNEIELFQ